MPGTMNRLNLPSLGCSIAKVRCLRLGVGGPLNTSEKHSLVLVGLFGTKGGFRSLIPHSVISATWTPRSLKENLLPMFCWYIALVIEASGSARAALGIGK